ncbi:hypothetical protein HK102_000085 [Quaeritorhiza haematococci]|nr:hypothetical protein HK102_000085 [Quaeritorhiza haematococci]
MAKISSAAQTYLITGVSLVLTIERLGKCGACGGHLGLDFVDAVAYSNKEANEDDGFWGNDDGGEWEDVQEDKDGAGVRVDRESADGGVGDNTTADQGRGPAMGQGMVERRRMVMVMVSGGRQ